MDDAMDDIGADAGAYLLVIELAATLALDVPRGAPATLEPGRYVYCGSAYGPGGIRARVRRHLATGKAVRWHVDRLTAAGRVVAVHAAPGGSECALFKLVMETPGGAVPAPGFGSSDCRRCEAHLARVTAGYLYRRRGNR